MKINSSLILGLIVLVLTITLVFVVSAQHKTPSVAVFNEKDTVAQYIKQLSQKNIDSSNIKAMSKRFKLALNDSLNEYAKAHSVVIVEPGMIRAGAKDVTKEVQFSIAKKMRGQQ